MAIAPTFMFYTRGEYHADLLHRLSHTGAGDYIALATMAFRPDNPGIHRILEALCAAARRGAEVRLVVDAYPFLIHNERRFGPLFFGTTLLDQVPKAFRPALEALQELKAAGGRYAVINQPGRRFTSPFAGRSHIKYAVINDWVCLGGCNLDSDTHLDLMVGWNDAATAAWYQTFAANVMAAGSVKSALHGTDLTVPVEPSAKLLVDAGISGQSIILDTALELIDAAKERILLTCQFFPADITARHLAAAHRRGVQVDIRYNHSSKHLWPYRWAHHGVLQLERSRLPGALFDNELPKDRHYIHAKLLITEQAAMIGSHNYVKAGVVLGTAETALLSAEPDFAQNALTALDRAIARNA